MKTLFDLCEPREDVLGGNIRESEFAADLAAVLRGNAPDEYKLAPVFFANTHPTEGLKRLLDNVCRRLVGKGGEANAIFRLDTQYGGGKTHALIALSHVAAGAQGVTNMAEFLDPALVPKQPVRVAAFDGENADPVNGRPLGEGVRAFTPWGELAYALGLRAGYEKVRASDVERVAPGADTLKELFAGKPALILLDELSVYLRKVYGRPEAAQLTPFLTGLFKAVESSPGVALVFTLAIGKGGVATDAYSQENQFLATKLAEAESVAARKATLLDPTAEHETAQVLRRRLFKRIDDAGAVEVVEAYRALWSQHATELPQARINEDRAAELGRGYPFHPALMGVLTDKLSTLSNFQRVRGMLRLLTQTVAHLWAERPADTYAVHLHHVDPGFEPIRNEILTRLELSTFDSAIRNDVSAADGAVASLAEQLDAKDYAGLPPFGSFVARTILWHSFAFNEHLKGATPEELRYAVLGPCLDPGFINDARQKFVAASAYLDDRPGVPLRFLSEANLTLLIIRQEAQVDREEARGELQDRIRTIFGGATFDMVPFVTGPDDVPDDVGNGKPRLALLGYDAETVRADRLQIPPLVERIFRSTGTQGDFRKLQNNLVFLVADDQQRDDMKQAMVRRLALRAMQTPVRLKELAEHQQRRVQELYQKSEQVVAIAIQRCYRHLFFPSRNNRVDGALVELGHTAFEIGSAAADPGQGQRQVERALVDNRKLLRGDDPPLAPVYVRDQTPLKKGQITTAALRAEFRKDPRLPILLGDDNFVALVRKGIDEDVYVYRSGELLLGKGDAWAAIKTDENSFVYTTAYAKQQGIWPRPPIPPDGGVHPPIGPIGPTPPPPPPPAGALAFHAEGPLREALTRIWEAARGKKVAKLTSLSLRVFDGQDAFKLLSVVNGIANADKRVEFTAEYETKDGSALSLEFKGKPDEGQPVKEFLDAQFRVASEKDLQTRYELKFTNGLPVVGDEPEKLTERLARYASGAAYVEAEAQGDMKP
jgi:hypothetical protein